MKRSLSSLIFFSLFLALASFAYSQNADKVDVVKYFDENKRWYNDYTEHWFRFFDIPEEEVRNSIIQWEKIGADLENAKEQWAGTFVNGSDTHGDYFRWSEKSGFVWLKVNKCAGGPMQIIRGRAIADSDKVQLFPEHISGKEHHGHDDHKKSQKTIDLLFVKWRDVPFLVNKDLISDFADYTAGLGDYNEHLFDSLPFLQKIGAEENDKAEELPVFPNGYEKFVKKPVSGQIVSIVKSFRRADSESYNAKNWEKLITQVRVNFGALQGAAPKLKLNFVGVESPAFEEIRIKKAGVNTSLVEIIRSVPKRNCVVTDDDDCESYDYPEIKVGMRVSTIDF